MAKAREGRREPETVVIHEDEPRYEHAENNSGTEELEESRGPLEESGSTNLLSDESDYDDVESSVAEDICKFEESFGNISRKYRFINRIGEGTFSTVYKAEDLEYYRYRNEWDLEEKENAQWCSPAAKGNANRNPKRRYVAVKKIYVTSSPSRILNELELLHDLKNSDSVCPLITAFRHHDQVIAILPYFRHKDFREYFRDFQVPDIRYYFRSLFTALATVHSKHILHRDIKPTNFLYNAERRRGVLVDFGLAEREGTDYHPCPCTFSASKRQVLIDQSYHTTHTLNNLTGTTGYPKEDTRPSRRANRAGTRGFRAPEVLLKCTAQTTKIDIWSAGVILLTILSKRFPFFHSADDIDATIELCTIFGKSRMRACSLLHGSVFETNIPTISDSGFTMEKIVLWSTNRNAGRHEHGRKLEKDPLDSDEKEAVGFLERCLELDPAKRISASEALNHPFLQIREDAEESEGSEDSEMY